MTSSSTLRRRPRKAAITGGFLVALLLMLLLALAPVLVDRDALRQRIELEMGAMLGTPVEVGAIDQLRLLPTPRVVLAELRSDGVAPARIDRARLDLSLSALFLNRVEPLRLSATGIDLSLPWPAIADRPAWLDGLSPGPPRILGGELTLDYPTDEARLHWPLFGAGRAPTAPPADAGPLRLAARLPLTQSDASLSANLRVGARIDLSMLPALEVEPLRITADDLDLGQPTDLRPLLVADRASRTAEGSWRVEGIGLTADTLRVTGELSTRQKPSGTVAAGGTFSIAPFDLRAWVATHARNALHGDTNRLRCLAARGGFELGDGLLRLSPVTLRLDETGAGFAARLRLESRPGPEPDLTARLVLDRLDLDAYLAPPPSQDAILLGPADAAGCVDVDIATLDTARLDLDALAALDSKPDTGVDVRIDAAIDTLILGGARFGELSVAVEQRGLLTELDMASSAFYDGRISAGVRHERAATGPSSNQLRAELGSVAVGPLLADVTGEEALSGSADLRAELSALGTGSAELRRSLSGTFELSLGDARSALLERTALDFRPLLGLVGVRLDKDTLTLQRLSLSATGTDGLFQSDDIDGRARLFRLDGDGRLDVTTEALGLDLMATLVQPPDGPDMQGFDGIEVPIRITGPWSAPDVHADPQPALAEAARRTAERHLDGDGNLFQQLEEATGVKGLEQGLRGLLGF